VSTDAEKNNFFNEQLYKSDIGQILKMRKQIRQSAPTSQNKQNKS
jgi:hypothetical protein